MTGQGGSRRKPFLFAVFFSLFLSVGVKVPFSFCAELIAVPGGAVLRSILSWEDVSSVKVSLEGRGYDAFPEGGKVDFFFKQEDFCKGASYELLRKETQEPIFQSLDHLCDYDDSSLTLAFISDAQEFHENHQKTALTLQHLTDLYPDLQLVINGGDLVQEGTKEEWRQYRAISSSYYSNRFPLVPVLGNHEFQGDLKLKWVDYFYKTEHISERYYWLDFGFAALIVLDSNVDMMSSEEQKQQTEWLKKTLESLTQEKVILVTYHHPAYSSGFGAIAMPVPPRYIRAKWLPLFKKYGVKLVLNGHEHIYERLNVDGVQYLVAGPAGGKMGRANPMENRYSQFNSPGKRTISIIQVSQEGSVNIVSYDAEVGEIIDEYRF